MTNTLYCLRPGLRRLLIDALETAGGGGGGGGDSGIYVFASSANMFFPHWDGRPA